MKTVIKQIALQNFGKHKDISKTFGNRTYIKGANEVGKSTIKRAIQFIFGVRDENGKEITGIRPHNKDGVDIDDLQTVVDISAVVDGEDVEWKKIYHQNLNKKGEMTGNSTDCYVDDIPKKSKDYEEYMSQILPNEVCINAMTLLNLDTQKRRKMLEDAFSEHTTDSIIDDNAEFETLRKMLNNATTSELKSKYRAILKGDKTHVGLEKALDNKIVEIRTVKDMYHDTDIAELELYKNVLKEQIAENKAKHEDVSKQFEEYQKLSDGIMELKFAEGDLHRKANEENIKKRREIEDKISDKKFLLMQTEKTISDTRSLIDYAGKNISEFMEELSKTRDEWSAEKERAFDENSLICPYCKQEYPNDKQDELRADFKAHKEAMLNKIADKGNKTKELLDNEKATFERLKKELPEHEKSLLMLNNDITDLEKQLSELPESIDISETEEYKAIQSQIAEKERALSQMNNADDIRSQLSSEYEELVQKLADVQSEIDYNSNLDLRIEKLEKERENIIANIGDNERMLDMIKRFENLKANILETDVNKHFEYVKFRMFEKQVNGDLKDICSPVVNGESYDRNLNHGAKILTEIDICRAFQKKYDVCLPIIVDDCESLDSWRIPQIENQLILIMRSNDEELKVEVA